MKSLEQMHNVDLAKLLASLFPEAIPALLHFMDGCSAELVAHPERLQTKWQDNTIVSFQTWIAVAQRVTEVIKQYGTKMPIRPSLFADQLFDGLLALYTRQAVEQYALRQDCPVRFRQGIQLVFKA